MFNDALKFLPVRIFCASVLLSAAVLFGMDVDSLCERNANLCGYYPIGVAKYPRLWTVPEGENVWNTAKAIPNASFFVYAPNDTLILKRCEQDYSTGRLNCTSETLAHPTASVTADDSGFVYLKAYSEYPVVHAPVGTLTKLDANPSVQRYYTFYLPDLEFSIVNASGDTVVVDEETLLSLPVDSALTVFVRAVVPVGPDSGKTDTLITKTFYLKSGKGSDNLRFTTISGDETSRVDLNKGVGSFQIRATAAVSGANFSANGFVSPKDSSDFLLSEVFPGSLTFENPDLPILDSAFIYDADGDGKGDSIIAYFSGKTDSVSWDSVFYSWPNETFREFSGDYKRAPNGSVMELLEVKTSIPENAAAGELKVHATSKVSGSSGVLLGTIEDRIGPVIQMATLISGTSGAKDTLILDFNKAIDTAFVEGSVLQLANGDKVEVQAVSKKGKRWTFVVKPGKVVVGDSLSVVVGLGDLGLVAADGNAAHFNLPAEVKNAGRVYLSNENNGFFDSDADGRMDSVTVGFENPISKDDLKNLRLQFFWKDTSGGELLLEPDPENLTLSADGKTVSYVLTEKEIARVQKDLTSIDDSEEYGYAALENISVVNGDTVSTYQYLDMNDRMAPVISSTFLSPESDSRRSPDRLTVTFSEPIDTASIANANFLGFIVDGDSVYLDFTYASWNDDLTQVTLLVGADVELLSRANPNDSLFVNSKAKLSDFGGNAVTETAKIKSIEGDPRVVMETASLVGLDRVALAADGPAFTERFFPEGTSTKEEMGKSLGVMLDVAFATIFDDSTGESLDLEKVGLHWTLDVYTNMGNFVAGGHGTIHCDDPDFGENCFENAKRLYLRWNLRSASGRKAGVGVYLAQFHLKVYGAKNSYTYDKIFKWGVHGGKGGLALDD